MYRLKFYSMIQRIQSLFLALVTLLSLLLFSGSYLKFTETTGSLIKLAFAGIIWQTAGQDPQVIQAAYPYSALVLLIPLVSLITIFIYRNRKLQILLVSALIILILSQIIVSVVYFMRITETYGTSLTPGVMMLIPVLMLIFSVLAYRGIKKDDEIVKSYDRLR